MTKHDQDRWIDAQDASRLLGPSPSPFIESLVFLTTWGILGAFSGLFWWWCWTLVR